MSGYDCTACGACCVNRDENRAEGTADYVEVSPRDALLKKTDLVRRYVVFNGQGTAHLKLDRDGRCAALRGALGRRVWCAVYRDRPSPCRRVEAGSDECVRARAERGLG